MVPASLQQEPQDQQTPPGRSRGRRRPPRLKPTHVHQFVVSALDRHTGKTIWETVVREEVPHEPGHITASQASASPVTDGEHIIAFYGSRGLFSLNMQGKVVWEKDLGTMATRNEFGEGSSPALHGDTVVVNWDHEGDSFIAAFDKRTGKELWRNARDEPTSWSTPFIIEDDGRALAVVSATNRVRAYDVKTGEDVWQCVGPDERHRHAPSGLAGRTAVADRRHAVRLAVEDGRARRAAGRDGADADLGKGAGDASTGDIH